MKKVISLLLAAVMVLSLAACAGNSQPAESNGTEAAVSAETSAPETTQPQEPETVTITALNGNKEEVQIEVPYNPQRIAILDFAALDAIDNLGLGDRVVGTATTTLDYLMPYTQKDGVAILGNIKEADLEAVMGCEPDIIFIGGRLSTYYDDLNEIAPVVFLATTTEEGVVESTRRIATTIASIFGLDDEIADKMAGFDSRIAALAAAAEGKTAVVGMCTSGSFNVLGDDGRCSIIGREIGFNNLSNGVVSETSSQGGEGGRGGSGEGGRGGSGEGGGSGQSSGGTSTHGNEASFELIVSLAPDYIFVMDRDSAIGTEGAQLAKEIMENELVMSTDAYKNGNLVILEHSNAWYTAEGGITALDYMLQDLEGALLN
ncbi:MAG: ABC transporter substrate-binding protein [Eubacteriales bacterium]|nr:ABC transporter substrate-binding protein [Eubacteriales bacterium]